MSTRRLRALVAFAPLAALAVATASFARTKPAPRAQADHQLSRVELEQTADRLGPAARAALAGAEREARAEIARAERAGRLTAAQRAAIHACLEDGTCGSPDAERALRVVVDRIITDAVEGELEPAVEAVLGS